MAQKYYINNLISKFVKCLLYDTYLPISNVWAPGKPLIANLTYITFDKNIVVALKDFNPNSGEEGPQTSKDSTYFKYVSTYVDNEFYPAITSNFESNSSLYDADTHYYLGQYLRFIRDMKGINLMPYYNCYSGISSDKFRINAGKLDTLNTLEDGYITYLVNIDFNQKYTIYYNSNTPLYILPVYYDGIICKPLTQTSGINYEPIKINSCSFNYPYVYSGINYWGNSSQSIDINNKLINKYIKLLIQVPINNSNLVVLEGDYSKCKLNLNTSNNDRSIGVNKVSEQYFDNLDLIDSVTNKKVLNDVELNKILTVSYPSLARNITNINYAFSDRLIEYLLYGPIVKSDKIRYNILRVQKALSSLKSFDIFGTIYSNLYKKDIWDSKLRVALYTDVIQNAKVCLFEDINGFIDKDSEYLVDKAVDYSNEDIF